MPVMCCAWNNSNTLLALAAFRHFRVLNVIALIGTSYTALFIVVCPSLLLPKHASNPRSLQSKPIVSSLQGILFETHKPSLVLQYCLLLSFVPDSKLWKSLQMQLLFITIPTEFKAKGKLAAFIIVFICFSSFMQ